MNAATWLKAPTFGMPRWVWISLLAGGVGVGLYLRSRPIAEDVEQAVEEPAAAASDSLASYEGLEQAGGLSAAGLVGPAPGAVVPVQTPFLPEGVEGLFASLAELATSLGATVSEISTSNNESAMLTGGGVPDGSTTVNTPPETPAPKPKATCSNADKAALRKAQTEVQRLQSEIANLQQIVSTRTNWIQAHPKSDKKNQWIKEREQAQGQITHKRNQVQEWSGRAQQIRNKPGCASVAV